MTDTTRPVEVTRRAARRYLIRRSGLGRAAAEGPLWPRPQDTLGAVRALEYVQVDPMAVLRQSQDLVLAARVGGYSPEVLEDLLYRERSLIEVVAFDRCIVPVEDYPLFRLKFRANERRYRARLHELEPVMRSALEAIEARGPLSSLDFDDPTRISGWWDADDQPKTKAIRQALEWLWHFGRVVISRREGLRRYFDLPERVFGPEPDRQASELAREAAGDEEEALTRGLATKYVRAMGLSCPNRFHFAFGGLKAAEKKAMVERLVAAGCLTRVEVGDSKVAYFISSEEREALIQAEDWEPSREVRFLGPLDNLIWDRDRLGDIFEFSYSWEAYVPAARRRYGPYTCPILHGDELVGRIDAKVDRGNSTLVVNGLWWERGRRPVPPVRFARALERWAAFNGAKTVEDPNRVLPARH